jgi:hypothetical protein
MLRDLKLLGMYRHSPTGEYRLLLNKQKDLVDEYACHIFALGSGQPPRRIGCADAGILTYTRALVYARASILLHGSLHWYKRQRVIVFDTITELFRHMRSPPIVSGNAGLFEIDGMLGIYDLNDEATIVDTWVMQDYEGKVWTYKHRVELPVLQIAAQFGKFANHWDWSVVVESLDGDLLVMFTFDRWLLQVDMNGKLVASFHRRGLGPIQGFKQTLVSHTFFSTLEGYVVNALPFV